MMYAKPSIQYLIHSLNVSSVFGNLFQVLGSTVTRQDSVGATSWWESQEEDAF